LIGATTQNPFFAVNSPLLSRSQIFTFQPLTRAQVKLLLQRALADKERGLGNQAIAATEEALDFLAEICDGDARRALSALEVGVLSAEGSPSSPTPLPKGERGEVVPFTLAIAQDSIQRKVMDFDPTGDA